MGGGMVEGRVTVESIVAVSMTDIVGVVAWLV